MEYHLLLVNGAWGEWSVYSNCTKTCGNGIQTRSRECNNPSPAYGGLSCSGPESQEQRCGLIICPNMLINSSLQNLTKGMGLSEMNDKVWDNLKIY